MHPLSNHGPLSGADGTNPAGPTPSTSPQAGASTGGPAFRALLERLQEKAAALHEASRGVADPAELKGAVDEARATLEDALSLGDRVLEAFRSARATGGVGDRVDDGSEG